MKQINENVTSRQESFYEDAKAVTIALGAGALLLVGHVVTSLFSKDRNQQYPSSMFLPDEHGGGYVVQTTAQKGIAVDPHPGYGDTDFKRSRYEDGL